MPRDNCSVLAALLLVVLCAMLPSSSGQTPTQAPQRTCLQMCDGNRRWLCSTLCSQSLSCDRQCYYGDDITSYFRRCQNLCSAFNTTETTSQPPPKQKCGISSVGRIVGGTRVSECEFPWAVMINIGTIYCGGTLVAANTVLTAGHCVYSSSKGKAKASTISIKYGSSNHWKAKTAYVTRVDIHPRFVLRYFDYDVALLKLDRNLTYGACVRPICLPEVGASPFRTEGCMAAGWGAVEFSRPLAQSRLRKVRLPIVPLSQCQAAYSSTRLVTSTKICAGDMKRGGIDSCLGDSGGPLMCYTDGAYHQFGVVSFGRACASAGSPGVYSSIVHSRINSWVKSNM